jgi:hypothetical protein
MEVRPGQVISSAVFNSLFATLMTRMGDLEDRVADLEAGSGGGADPVAITGFSPPSQAKVNEALAILGRGFIFPPSTPGTPTPVPTNTVIVNGVQMTLFLADSTTERLSFLIPPSLNITTPTVVTVQVSNELGESQPRTYTILPPDPITAPQPTITGVAPQSNPLNLSTAIVGQIAVVDGTNFLTDATKMTVTFTVPPPVGGSPHVYTVESSQLSALTATRFNVMVPEITEVPALDSKVVIVGVRVEGNSLAGTRAIQAYRA